MNSVDNMRRVGAVTHVSFSGDFGGREKVALGLCRGMLDAGLDCHLHIVVEARAGDERNENLMLRLGEVRGFGHLFKTRARFSPRLLVKLAASFREHGIAVAHCHCYKSLYYTLLMRLFGLYKGAVVYTLHGLILPKGVMSSLIHAVQQFGLHRADGVIGCSREILRSSFPDPLGVKTDSIINAIELPDEDYEALAAGKADARRELVERYGLDPEGAIIINVGRLNPQKNYPLYLELIRQRREASPEGKENFLIVGSGELRDELGAMAVELGVDDDVIFTGFVSDMDTLYRGADVLVQTSVWEGTPMCLLEARSYALPAVAPAVGGNVDVVRSGEDGVLYPVGDLGQLAEGLDGYLADAGVRASHGRRAFDRVKDDFSIGVWVQRHADFYLSVLGRNG